MRLQQISVVEEGSEAPALPPTLGGPIVLWVCWGIGILNGCVRWSVAMGALRLAAEVEALEDEATISLTLMQTRLGHPRPLEFPGHCRAQRAH